MKKQIPLIVLEALQTYVDLKSEEFEVINPNEFLVKVIDNDPDSDFYFNIEDYKIDRGTQLLIDRKPFTKSSVKNERRWIDGKQLDVCFQQWVSLLNDYKKIRSFYDDPIIKSFTDNYYAEFEIIDDEENDTPLTPKQILLLDEHLEYIEQNIDKYETELNSKELVLIKTDVQKLRESITSKSKKWVLKNLSKIWAKLTKQGTKFLKDFISEAKRQAIKQGVKYLMGQGNDLLN